MPGITSLSWWQSMEDEALRTIAYRCSEGFIEKEKEIERLSLSVNSSRESLARLLHLQATFGDLRIPIKRCLDELITWLHDVTSEGTNQQSSGVAPETWTAYAMKLYLWGRENRSRRSRHSKKRIGKPTSTDDLPASFKLPDSLWLSKHLSEGDLKTIRHYIGIGEKHAATDWQAQHHDDWFGGRRASEMEVETLVKSLKFKFNPNPDDPLHVFDAFRPESPTTAQYEPRVTRAPGSTSTADLPTNMDQGFPDFAPVRRG